MYINMYISSRIVRGRDAAHPRRPRTRYNVIYTYCTQTSQIAAPTAAGISPSSMQLPTTLTPFGFLNLNYVFVNNNCIPTNILIT